MTEKTLSQQALKISFLCACWYTFSSANSVLGKQMLSVFPYPTTLSMVHVLSSTCCLGPALALLDVDPTPHLSRRFYLKRIVPLAVGKVLASISAHVSIWKVPVSYAHTVKAMMPFFTVLLSLVILRESYPLKVYLSLVPIVSGVLLATVTELSFDLTGMLAALTATLCFALQNIYSKKCMKEVHIHHLRLLLLLSQLSCILLFPFWMCTDVWELITKLHKIQHLAWLLFALPLNGFLNFGQNIVAFSMISAVSPVSYSVANATKRIVIISTSLLFLRNPVTPFNICGMLMSISGVALYNKVKYDSNKQQSRPVLPTKHPDLSDNDLNSDAFRIDLTGSSPMKII